ncbi:MAG: DUF167 domain-containing protein [Hyphomicrobiales bacterium]
MRVSIHVTPKSRAEGIETARAEGRIRVRVTAAPEGGRANEAVIRLLAERLGVPRTAIRVVGGATARRKWIEIDGMEEAELWRRLEAER